MNNETLERGVVSNSDTKVEYIPIAKIRGGDFWTVVLCMIWINDFFSTNHRDDLEVITVNNQVSRMVPRKKSIRY